MCVIGEIDFSTGKMTEDLFNTFNYGYSLTYRGSKRKMLGRISSEIKHACKDCQSILDLFSGSGVVANYFRYQGMESEANDVSIYSEVINKVNLEYGQEFLDRRRTEIKELIAECNSLIEPVDDSKRYISIYYSENEDVDYQRLFFTKRNGLFIDAVLERIEEVEEGLRLFVLNDLLIKMMKHSNTNGIFSGFYKQFGGPDAQCLGRIKKDIVLAEPIVYEGKGGKAYRMDARALLEESERSWDVVYLDPPYNSHQYSSNYHLLDTVCLPIEERFVPSDSDILGISPETYKSPYSRKTEALEEMDALIEACSKKSSVAIISYNATGHISLQELEEVCDRHGKTEIQSFEIRHYIGSGDRGADGNAEELILSVRF